MTPIVLVTLAASLFTTFTAAPAFADTTLCSGAAYGTCTGAGYTDHGYGAHSGASYWGMYAGHNCTNYAAYVLSTVNGAPRPPRQLGDAQYWDNNAPAGTVNTTPGMGAIAQWEASTMRRDGHVAYVESYTTSGGSVTSITVSEDKWSSGPFAWKTITAGSANWPDHFIHIKDLPNGSPFGSFDGATGRVGGAVQVSGWTIDPDAPTTPTAVHVYIDGPAGSGARGVNLGLADVPRPDVGAANPGAGNNHGFNTTITGVSPGMHTLYAYAINAAGGGANPLLRTLQATVPGPDPIGRLDSAHGAVGGFIGVNGWTIDPDAPTTSGQVHVYIDGPAGSGARGVAVPAAVDRPDVAAAYPGAGPAHGYSSAIGGISPGPHTIWVYLINIAGGGSNPLLTTANVTVPAVAAGSPFGSFDGASDKGGGAAQVTGWTIDPDARTTPTQVHIYIDGPAGSGVRGVNLGLADGSRPDVGAAFPGSGDAHGFNTTITGLSPGVHTLWAYAINAAGGGANPLLRTLQVTVSG
jgi:surface antigen